MGRRVKRNVLLSWWILYTCVQPITISMFSSNILPSFSLAQWIILFYICIIFLYIIKKDIKSRLIPNIFTLWVLIWAIIWNIENFTRNWWIFLENILQFFLLSIIGYLAYWRNSIGAGDIKLALVLSLFFLSFSSPLIFLGNTAVITIVFVFWYILGGLIYLIGKQELFQEMKILFYQKYQWIHSKYLSGTTVEIGRKFWSEQRENIDNQSAIFLILIGIRFFIVQFVITEIPAFTILWSNTSLILGFYVLSPLLYWYIQEYKKDIWWKIWFFIGTIVFLAIQKNILWVLISLFFQSILLLSFFLLLLLIIRKVINFLLLFIDRKWIHIREVKSGDILNIHATQYFWEKSQKNDQISIETVFSMSGDIPIPSFLQENKDLETQTTDHEKYWWYISKISGFPFQYISIQQTLPYGIFLIIGFWFTFFTHAHLAQLVMNTLRDALHF